MILIFSDKKESEANFLFMIEVGEKKFNYRGKRHVLQSCNYNRIHKNIFKLNKIN